MCMNKISDFHFQNKSIRNDGKYSVFWSGFYNFFHKKDKYILFCGFSAFTEDLNIFIYIKNVCT